MAGAKTYTCDGCGARAEGRDELGREVLPYNWGRLRLQATVLYDLEGYQGPGGKVTAHEVARHGPQDRPVFAIQGSYDLCDYCFRLRWDDLRLAHADSSG